MQATWGENLEKIIRSAAEEALADAGVKIALKMKDHIRDGAQGESRLGDSVTYATQRRLDRNMVGPRAEDDHVITQPLEAGQLKVGTRSPYAKYFNWGSLPIGQGSGTGAEGGGFRENILQWAIDKFGDTEETRAFADGVARKIAENGQDGYDFLGMTRADAQRIIAVEFPRAFRWRCKAEYVPTVTEIVVDLDTSYTRKGK